jgi:hypothetical protein
MPRPAWDTAGERERATVQSMLQSPDWPYRVLALLRLARYDGATTAPLLKAALRDPVWQVRAFAVRESARAGLALDDADLAGETDPYVIRTVLRHARPLPAASVAAAAQRRLESNDLEEFLLGLEIAAASDAPEPRALAARRLVALIRNLNDARAALVSRRLGRVLDVHPAPETARGWAAWLASQPAPVQFPPPQAGAEQRVRQILGTDPVAALDESDFVRLRTYLDGLRQRDLDVAIALDSTFSMLPMIHEAQMDVDDLILFLGDVARTMRLAFVSYRDHDNEPVTQVLPFTTDLQAIRRFLYAIRVTGGRDYPEAVMEAVAECEKLQWNPRANRQVILVGDAPPHEEGAAELRSILERARLAETPVHTVHVPMRRDEGHHRGWTNARVAEDRAWLDRYNATTAAAFSEIALLGGGQGTRLQDAEGLVPAIMHFSIEASWWPIFDAFYKAYVDLCR